MSPEEPSLGHGATHSARLLISCPDGPGIVAAVGSFLYDVGANIVSSDQYSTHPERGSFFMRVMFFLPGLADDRGSFAAAFEELAQRSDMDWRISYAGEPKRAVLMDQHPPLVPAGVRGRRPLSARLRARGQADRRHRPLLTEELDAGPIIDQDVQRVGHDYSIEDLIRVGRDVERVTLSRALRSHLDDRVLVHDGRTIVF